MVSPGSRRAGRLTDWNDARGFGFITPTASPSSRDAGARVFVHLSAFERGTARPTVGTAVTYSVTRDSHGRLRAVGVVGPARLRNLGLPGNLLAAAALVTLAVLVLGLRLLWGLTAWVAVAYAVASVLCFVLYAADKSAARAGRWRTRESTLLLLGLIGGWPGALLAQRVLRHKNAKPSFQRAFWMTVILNLVVLVAVAAVLRP